MDMTPISNLGGRLTALLTPGWQAQTGARPELFQVIRRVRGRWRLRLLLNGLFKTLAIMLLLFVVSSWLLSYWHFSSPSVWSLRFIMICALVGLLLQICVKPLRRRVSDTSVALYLQEHEPAIKSIMLSAVDATQSAARDTSPQLVTRLVEQALDACEKVGFGHEVERHRLRQAATKLGLVLLLCIGLLVAPPSLLRHGAIALLMPWTSVSQYSPFRIELSPGNIEISRGDDQLISARIDGFDGDDVLLLTSRDGGGVWQQTTMTPGSSPGVYESYLFDLSHAVDYYVDGAHQQTGTYRIEVANIPAISEIGLRYHFPEYTMLAPETSQGSGDIAALHGTRVEVLIEPTIDIPGGALLLEDGARIELVKNHSREWIGELTVERDSGYRVELQRASGIAVDASSEYRITALDDEYPGVSILSPGRDTKVSMIEEPVMKVRATDDLGIAKLELVLSVNGAPERRVTLTQADAQTDDDRQLDAEHVIYLEDLNLSPGDLISYYVQAEDRAAVDQRRNATSDIFFYQVRPFSVEYRSADQQGGGGGANGGQQQEYLSDQQKQFVVATFKMIRDRARYDAQTYRENLELLARAQARIRDRVEAIVRRIGSRPIAQLDQRYRIITEELPLAAEAMVEVEKQLQQIEIESALSDAQVALTHLQRADAAFREINVALANRAGGGAGNNTGSEELADLFRLEMDSLRQQYETVRRGQQQSPQRVIDEVLERLRELAQRQQQEVERQMRREDRALNHGSNSKQLALAEELEQMTRQLERLSRIQPKPQLQQSIDQMRSAAEAMRRAAASANGGGGAGVDQARQAAENLREAQRQLDQSQVQQFGEAVEQSLRRAELAEKRQAAIKQEVTQLGDKWGDKLKAQLEQLDNQKQALAKELVTLESELNQLATTAREQQPQTSQPLKQAIRASREYRLQDRIGRTRTMVQLGEIEQAIDNENKIQEGIAQVRARIESALANVGQQGPRGLQRSLDQMRDLARQLQYLRGQASSGGANRSGAQNPDHGSAWGGNPAIARQLEGIAANAGELKRQLLNLGVASGEIGPVLDKISEMTRKQNDQDSPANFEDVLSAVMELEYRLRQRLQQSEFPKLLASDSIELAEDDKEMVADYFRELSR